MSHGRCYISGLHCVPIIIKCAHITVCSFSELVAHSNAIFDLAWLPGGTKLVGFITKLLT